MAVLGKAGPLAVKGRVLHLDQGFSPQDQVSVNALFRP